MKKFLLLLITAVASLCASAQTTIQWASAADWTTFDGGISYTQDGFKSEAVKNDGSTVPNINANSNDLRIYAKGTLTVSGKQLTKIVFNISSQGLKRLAEVTPSTGNVAVADDHKTVTWTGDAASVSFTVGEKAVYGTDGASKAGQFDITNFVITGEGSEGGEGGDIVTPPVADMTIAEAQAAEAGTNVSIAGTVVAACKQGAVIGDATGYIFYYNTACDLVVGDVVSIDGAVSAYGGFNQLTAAAEVTKEGKGKVTYPEVVKLDGAGLDAWFAEPQIQYVQITGELVISGNYYNLNVEGAETAAGSLIKPLDSVLGDVTNNSKVTITGFAMYVSGTKYVNIVATELVIGEKAETVDITNTLETAYSVSKCIELIDAGKGLENKVYIKGIVCAPYKDMFIDLGYGNATFFISEDGNAESQQFEIYRGYDFGGEKFTEEKIKLGDEVVFYGTMTKYKETYETNQGAELVLLNGANGISNITTDAANTVIYDLTGRRVNRAEKGLYIINGKKVLR